MKNAHHISRVLLATCIAGIFFLASCGNGDDTTAPLTLRFASRDDNFSGSRVMETMDKSGGGDGHIVTDVQAIQLQILEAKLHFAKNCEDEDNDGEEWSGDDGCSCGHADSLGSGSFEGWVSLPVDTGMVNIMQFSPNVPLTLVKNFSVPSGKISELRLILGSNNTVTIGNVNYPLKVPSGMHSGYKIKLHQFIQANVYTEFLLLMDPSHSVRESYDGNYFLKPVIHASIIL